MSSLRDTTVRDHRVDYAFFEKLTPQEASDFLEHYRRAAAQACDELVRRAAAAGVPTDFTPASTAALLRWTVDGIATVPLDPGTRLEGVPDWIRDTPGFLGSLFEFDEASRPDILGASFHLGESFVQASPDRLRWATGDRETALMNQPVVAGFQHHLELSPVMVTESLMSRLIKYPDRLADVDRAVGIWQRNAGLTED